MTSQKDYEDFMREQRYEIDTQLAEERTTEERALSIEEGWFIREFGDDEWTEVTKVDSHGDTMLIWGFIHYDDGKTPTEPTFDIDEVIERRLP